MKRRIGYVETIDWSANNCRVRIPNLDGLNVEAYSTAALSVMLQGRSATDELSDANIPYHLQGLRVGDIVYVLDSEDDNDDLAILGFFGGVYNVH